MTTLRKAERVLYHFGTNPESGHALYVQMEDEATPVIDGLTFPMSRDLFEDFSQPAEITLTIERGDRLNASPDEAAPDPEAAVRRYLDILESTKPSPKVQAVIDEIRAAQGA